MTGVPGTTSSKLSWATANIVYASGGEMLAESPWCILYRSVDIYNYVQTPVVKVTRAAPVARFRNRNGRRARIRAADCRKCWS